MRTMQGLELNVWGKSSHSRIFSVTWKRHHFTGKVNKDNDMLSVVVPMFGVLDIVVNVCIPHFRYDRV